MIAAKFDDMTADGCPPCMVAFALVSEDGTASSNWFGIGPADGDKLVLYSARALFVLQAGMVEADIHRD